MAKPKSTKKKKPRKFCWTFELCVSENWVADGFGSDIEAIKELLLNSVLDLATSNEKQIRVLWAPTERILRRVQGR